MDGFLSQGFVSSILQHQAGDGLLLQTRTTELQ
jgi:hypothetical protein